MITSRLGRRARTKNTRWDLNFPRRAGRAIGGWPGLAAASQLDEMVGGLPDTQRAMAAIQGDREDAFKRLYSRHFGTVENFVRRRASSAADVDDAVSEVFFVAWRRFDAVPGEELELAWLYGVAGKVLGNQRRSSARRVRLWQRLSGEPQATTSLAGHSAGSERGGAVLEALQRLNGDQREILTLAYWEGLEPREIGVAVGCSPNAARIRLHRARKRLEVELSPISMKREVAGGSPTAASKGDAQ